MTFGEATTKLQTGSKVARSGWNGKNMWLSLTPGQTIAANLFWSNHNRKFAEQNGGSAEVLPYITMKTADNKIVPWLASQTDVLATDWIELIS